MYFFVMLDFHTYCPMVFDMYADFHILTPSLNTIKRCDGCMDYIYVKQRKFVLEQSMKAQRESRGIALLLL